MCTHSSTRPAAASRQVSKRAICNARYWLPLRAAWRAGRRTIPWPTAVFNNDKGSWSDKRTRSTSTGCEQRTRRATRPVACCPTAVASPSKQDPTYTKRYIMNKNYITRIRQELRTTRELQSAPGNAKECEVISRHPKHVSYLLQDDTTRNQILHKTNYALRLTTGR